MPEYALLMLPAANRVYGTAAGDLALAELETVARRWPAPPAELRRESLAAVDYLRFHMTSPLSGAELAAVGRLSSAYALFLVDGRALLPVEAPVEKRFHDDLITIQRYQGKTNEQFTHLLVNVAVAISSAAAGGRAQAGRRLLVLDPLCGRGTTLNRALLHGYDAAGIDADARATEAYRTFLSTWLKDKRIKHHFQQEAIRRGPAAGSRRWSVAIGRPEQARVEVITDGTSRADLHIAQRVVDALVADLPYGVRHGAEQGDRRLRSPLGLLQEALPVWRTLLRPGAGMALAWNRRTAARADMEAAVVEAGFVLEPPPTTGTFEHWVDRTITRDVVVATAP